MDNEIKTTGTQKSKNTQSLLMGLAIGTALGVIIGVAIESWSWRYHWRKYKNGFGSASGKKQKDNL